MPALNTVLNAPEVLVTWVKVDDGWPDHPKFLPLSHIAARLWLHAACWCSRKLTDGRVPATALPTLLPQDRPKARQAAAEELVAAGIFHAESDGWRIHDFLDYNPSKEQVLSRREKRNWRKELTNNYELRYAIKARDGDHCRYCWERVSWTDRRGPKAATYDHVHPEGDHSLENIVIACRDCNLRKGARSPEQARMPLRDPRPKSQPKSDLGPARSEPGPDLDRDLLPDPDPDPQVKVQPDTSDRSPSDGRALWGRIIEELDLQEHNRKHWFEPCAVHSYEPGRLVINARKPLIGEWLNKHFRKRIAEVAKAIEPGLRVDLITKPLSVRAS